MSSTSRKISSLHGRAFYESIGSPKFVLAPMVDQSEYVCISFHLRSYALLMGALRPGECLLAPS